MPRTTVRVVCGREEVMATFVPTRALVRVDLPALGRPTKEAKPLRKSGTRGLCHHEESAPEPSSVVASAARTLGASDFAGWAREDAAEAPVASWAPWGAFVASGTVPFASDRRTGAAALRG